MSYYAYLGPLGEAVRHRVHIGNAPRF
jgi:hypothetical protein